MIPRDQARAARLKRVYGLTIEQYEKMFEQQHGVCWICGWKPKVHSRRLHIDHDHKTGRVRGLLCFTCNRYLVGRHGESVEKHRMAAAYLSRDYDGRKL